MNLLALDTSTEFLSLALQVRDEVFSYHAHVGNATSQHILPQISALLTQADIQLNQLDGIAFGAGPGSFTGVRIAAGVTQGLAMSANLPVVSVCTLLALAHDAGHEKVITCLDARMREIYHAAYEKQDGQWVEVVAPNVCAAAHAPTVVGNGWVGVGNGWLSDADALKAVYVEQVERVQENLIPTARAILSLATPKFVAKETVPATEAIPLYVRNRVAMTIAERAQAGMK